MIEHLLRPDPERAAQDATNICWQDLTKAFLFAHELEVKVELYQDTSVVRNANKALDDLIKLAQQLKARNSREKVAVARDLSIL